MPLWFFLYLLSFGHAKGYITAPPPVITLPPVIYAPCRAQQVAKGRTLTTCF